MANHLANETSPYLLQHAGNPVDWYPWGEGALAKARREDKPIFLSIGYSACHWCHVMAHESFENDETAAILNRLFVSIKVDREERPDLDQVYMTAVQTLTGSGGWPMSVFLTPDGLPFYGGTYFPPSPRHGLPSFPQILSAIGEAWHSRRKELVTAGQRLAVAIDRQGQEGVVSGSTGSRHDTLHSAFRALQQGFDKANGGWGRAPKFPQPMVLEFLMRYHHIAGNPAAMDMVTHTLAAMARGGIYDQLGGGFHRYSVDDHWLVPHFEKMLYDEAQLSRVYLHAWQATGQPLFRAITEETLDYVMREMTDPAGGFYSTQDADSEGEEGKFFVWTPAEIRRILGDEADAFMDAYGVTLRGNWEGKSILELTGLASWRTCLAEARRKLFEAREKRVRPSRDEKVVTSWNGLMLAAFAEAARALDRDDYCKVAERNAAFLLRELRQENGRLLRTWKAGRAKLNAYLEDYAYVADGLIELYQTTFELRWFAAADEIAEALLTHFGTPDGGLYDTSDDHETLITRPRDLQDNATPSGNAMTATALLKLAGLAVNSRYVEVVDRLLAQMQPVMAEYPLGFGQWLQAQSYGLAQPREIAIAGNPDAADTHALLDVARDGYRPFQVVALGAPYGHIPGVPLLAGRGLVDGQAAAYVCRNWTCQAPVADPQALRDLLVEHRLGVT